MEYNIPFATGEGPSTRSKEIIKQEKVYNSNEILANGFDYVSPAPLEFPVNLSQDQKAYTDEPQNNFTFIGDKTHLVGSFLRPQRSDSSTLQKNVNVIGAENNRVLSVIGTSATFPQASQNNFGFVSPPYGSAQPNIYTQWNQYPKVNDQDYATNTSLIFSSQNNVTLKEGGYLSHDNSSLHPNKTGTRTHRDNWQHFDDEISLNSTETSVKPGSYSESWQQFEPNYDNNYTLEKPFVNNGSSHDRVNNFGENKETVSGSGEVGIYNKSQQEIRQSFEPNTNYTSNKTDINTGLQQEQWHHFNPNNTSNDRDNNTGFHQEQSFQPNSNITSNKTDITTGLHRENWQRFDSTEDVSYGSIKAGLSNDSHRVHWQQFEPDDHIVDNHIPNLLPSHIGNIQNSILDGYTVSNRTHGEGVSEFTVNKLHVENVKSNTKSTAANSDQYAIANFTGSSRLPHSQIISTLDRRAQRHSNDNMKYAADGLKHTPNSTTKLRNEITDFKSGSKVSVNPSTLLNHSGRKSAPVFSTGEDNDSFIWQPFSGYSNRYSDIEQSGISLFSQDNQDNFIQRLPPMASNKSHSVDTNIFRNTILYEPPLIDNSTVNTKRKLFATNYGIPVSSSLPDTSNIKKMYKSSDPTSSRDRTIFRTSSSGSLLSDSSFSTSPPTTTSRDLHNKFSRFRNKFSYKKMTSKMPFDDSMDFGIQESTIVRDDVKRKDKDKIDDGGKNDSVKDKDQEISPAEEPAKESETEPEAKSDKRTCVYKRRWYLLFLFSVSAMLWNAVWSTWGPIAQSAKLVYDWTDGDIAMFIWLGNIPFLITMFPSAYLMDVSGMRKAMIAACIFMFLGTGFRCIPCDISTASWLIRLGQFLNGMAGTIPNSGPALLSALWFPPNQRASATAISTVAGYMGASISFIIGPLLVPEPDDLSPVNSTDDDVISAIDFTDSDNTSSTSANTTDYSPQKTGIMNILYAECAVAGVLLLLVVIYFPSKPPLPPSISASIPREKYIKGVKMLVRNRQFWVCALAFSVPIGVYEAWQVILDVNLDSKGISQETAGWLDFYATLGGCVSGLLVSRFADFFTRQMKLFLLVFYIFASVAILWFTLVVLDIIPFDDISIYAAIIIAGVFLDGGGPLFFELTIEVSYPVGEGVTSGFTQMLCAAAGIIFLSIVQIESLGKDWMNWCFFGCVAIAIPLLFFINTTYGRADIDDDNEASDVEEDAKGSAAAVDSTEKTLLCNS